MRKINYWFGTENDKKHLSMEVRDDTTDEEIDEAIKEEMEDYCTYGWEEELVPMYGPTDDKPINFDKQCTIGEFIKDLSEIPSETKLINAEIFIDIAKLNNVKDNCKTIGDLINILKTYPQDIQVVNNTIVEVGNGDNSGTVYFANLQSIYDNEITAEMMQDALYNYIAKNNK